MTRVDFVYDSLLSVTTATDTALLRAVMRAVEGMPTRLLKDPLLTYFTSDLE